MKNMIKKIIILVAVLGSLSFISCSDLNGSSAESHEKSGRKTTVSFSVDGMESRTIMPKNMKTEDVVKAVITGEKLGLNGNYSEYTFDNGKTSLEWESLTDMQKTSVSIDAGTYNFMLELWANYDEGDLLTQTGKILKKEIVAGKENSLSFDNMEYARENGNLSIKIYWPCDEEGQSKIGSAEAGLFTIEGKDIVPLKTDEKIYDLEPLYNDFDNEYRDDINSYVRYFSYNLQNVPNGSYYLITKIYACCEEGATPDLLGTITDIVKIHGFKTEKEITLDLEKLNFIYNVTFNLNGGAWVDETAENSRDRTRNAYEGISLPGASEIKNTDSEYNFAGWYYIDEDGTEIKIESIDAGIESAQDYTLYAKWVKFGEATISVKIDVDESSDIEASYKTSGTDIIITASNKTKDNKKAIATYKWKVDGVEQEETTEILTVDASSNATGIYDISLIARDSDGKYYSWLAQIEWTRLYTVKFDITDAPEGTEEIESQYVAENAETKILQDPGVNPTYGWYVDEKFTEEFDIKNEVTKSMTLHGCWNLGSDIYVGENGEDGDERGTGGRPLATIAAAVALMTDSTKDYTIHVDGTVTGAQSIAGTISAKSITIEGLNGLNGRTGEPKDELNGGFSDSIPGTTLTIGSTGTYSSLPSVTIKNLKITGGYVKGNGAGIIAGMGARLTISDGTFITGNTAALNGTSGGCGGGIYLCEQVYFTIEGGSITGNSAVDGAGIYTNSTIGGSGFMGAGVMTGGTISANTASGKGGGVFISGKDAFMMKEGLITGNTAAKGNGVYVAELPSGSSPGQYSLILGENAQIASNNDVYLANNKAVYLSSPLSEKSHVATITLESYTAGNYVLARTQTPSSTANIPTESSKFAVTPQKVDGKDVNWVITKGGTLLECNATAETVSSFIEGLTETTTVRLCGEISNELLPTIGASLRTLYNTSGKSSIEVALDLSYTTGLKTVSSDAFFKNNDGSSTVYGGCNNLTSVLLPEGVTEIKELAFSSCSKLESINIPSTVTVLNARAFSQCDKLSIVTLPNGSDTFTLESDNALYSKDGTKLILYCDKTSEDEFTIPASVTEIGDYAFEYAKISGINFAEESALLKIGYSAFRSVNITSLILPDGIETIDYYAFYSCRSLSSVLIPVSVTKIEYCAFGNITKNNSTNPTLTVNYKGSEEQKNAITIDSGAFNSTTATWVYNWIPPIGDKTAPNSIGDIVFNDGSAIAYTEGMELTDAQKAAAIAVIFYIGTDLNNSSDSGSRTLGVGLAHQKEEGTKWCSSYAKAYDVMLTSIKCVPEDMNQTTYTFSSTAVKNGSQNLEKIAEQLGSNDDTTGEGAEDYYPAFYFAKNYKNQKIGDETESRIVGTSFENGWYLPSAAEMYQIYKCIHDTTNGVNLDTVSSLLGGNTFGENEYWTSSQYNNVSDSDAYILTMKMENGIFSYWNKASVKKFNENICAIRQF